MSGEGHLDEVLDGNEESAIEQKEIILDIEEKSLVFCSNRKHGCIVFVSWCLWNVAMWSDVWLKLFLRNELKISWLVFSWMFTVKYDKCGKHYHSPYLIYFSFVDKN